MMQLNLGTNIRQLRHRDGRTQEALAEVLGVTAQAVSRWEANGSYPDMNLIPSIANYFGVTIDELFGYTNEREQKIDALVNRIMDMKWENNGIDANLDDCIALARDALAESAPDLWGSKQFLRVYACDGKQQAKECGETLLYAIHSCAALTMHCIYAYKNNMTAAEKVQSIRSAIALFAHVCPDGNYGAHHSFISKLYGMLALYLWLDDKHDDAFDALEQALVHAKLFQQVCEQTEIAYTAPLVRLAKADMPLIVGKGPQYTAASLPDDWPWWSVTEKAQVKQEMQADPRWAQWVAKTQA